jgi:hypothetical protein
MATTRIAAQSLLGTVTTVANTLSTIVGTIDKAATIGGNYVDRHLQLQGFKTVLELEDAKSRLLENTANEITERRKLIAEKLKDPTYSKIYEETYVRLESLLKPAEQPETVAA